MDTGGEVVLGSALFTLVEPHKGHEVEYNRWYERDHFYAGCMVGPWLFAGRRWVATRDLKAKRLGSEPDLFGEGDPGSYLAVYWVLEGKHDEHFSWGLRQVTWLHDNGRMFPERDHVHTLLYRYLWSSSPASEVPPELALDHPYETMIATFVQWAGGGRDGAIAEWLESTGAAGLNLGMQPIPLPESAPVSQNGMTDLDTRTLVLSFHDEPADEVWDAHTAACERLENDGVGTVLWSGPFKPTIPGTDTYTDELW